MKQQLSQSKFKDFMGNPIQVGDYVYRNQKLHKVLKRMKLDEYGNGKVQIDIIYPYTWKRPQIHRVDELVIIPPAQMTAFLLTHSLPVRFNYDA